MKEKSAEFLELGGTVYVEAPLELRVDPDHARFVQDQT